MLEMVGVIIPLNKVQDTMIRARLIDETLTNSGGNYSLDYLGQRYLDTPKYSEIYDELAKLFGGNPTRNQQMKNMPLVSSSVVEPYAKRDTRLTYNNLYHYQEKLIIKQGIRDICLFEREIQQILIGIERGWYQS